MTKKALTDHMAVAQSFYDERYKDISKRLLLFSNGDFYWWHNPHWEQQETQAIRTALWTTLAPAAPEKKHIDGALDALKAVAFEPLTSQAPCWLGEYVPDLPDPHNLIACMNGLLDIETRTLLPLTPDFFNHNYLPINYTDEATDPKCWLEFLASLFPDDQESIDCLQEIFGLLLTQDTGYHKIFLLIGPKRSGKSTIARILTALLGQSNVASPTLSGLVATAYSCECLINTQLAVIGDARMQTQTATAISEILLGVSGEDGMTIQRKYKAPWSGRLNTRFMILSNEVPALLDSSGALASRIVAIETQQSFYGREDLGLEAKLLRELHEIFHWALDGLAKLKARGYFIQPASGEDLRDELQRSSSPISQFIEDKCEIGQGFQIECSVLYTMYSDWCVTQGRKPGTVQGLGRILKAAAPSVTTSQRMHNGVRERFFDGIRRK